MKPSDLQNCDFLPKGPDLDELLSTKEGRREVWLFIMRERIAHGLARVWCAMELPLPSKEAQEHICSLMWDSLLRKPLWELLDESDQAKSLLEKFALVSDVGAMLSVETEVGGNA